MAQQDRQGMVLVFMVSLGLRRGEACGLRWANVDLEQRQCRIVENLVTLEGKPHVSTPKSVNGRRTVPLSQEAAALLKAWQSAQAEERAMVGEDWQDTGYVFTTHKGTHLHPDNLTRALNRLCEQAGLRRIRVHDLRHTYASLMLSRQVPLEVVSKQLGHSSPAFTLGTYRHVSQQEHSKYALNISDVIKASVRHDIN
ncbi:site-specific integrase [Deinococcus sp. JMULE3]|uniref:site-specific integrase n=1 Tax=Deinococcus sp. JMULE3 TaxID=2518341 RepID=UPI001575966A|nr:site-specific integrase [Deinococcus sp. JMULE3]